MKNEIHAFIVRIWHESTDVDGDGTVWRGSVNHVGSDKKFYFSDLDGIAQYIKEQVGYQKRLSNSWLNKILIQLSNGYESIRSIIKH